MWFVFVAKITGRSTYFAKWNSTGERLVTTKIVSMSAIFDSFLHAKAIVTSIDLKKCMSTMKELSWFGRGENYR